MFKLCTLFLSMLYHPLYKYYFHISGEACNIPSPTECHTSYRCAVRRSSSQAINGETHLHFGPQSNLSGEEPGQRKTQTNKTRGDGCTFWLVGLCGKSASELLFLGCCLLRFISMGVQATHMYMMCVIPKTCICLGFTTVLHRNAAIL